MQNFKIPDKTSRKCIFRNNEIGDQFKKNTQQVMGLVPRRYTYYLHKNPPASEASGKIPQQSLVFSGQMIVVFENPISGGVLERKWDPLYFSKI